MRIVASLIYLFIFMPVAVVIGLSFNPDPLGSLSFQRPSLHWFAALKDNHAVMIAFERSLLLAALTALVTALLGVITALAIERYDFCGKSFMAILVMAPIFVPEIILSVSLLLLLNAFDLPRNLFSLLMGHVVISLPFTILIVRSKLITVKRDHEEAAMTLGANTQQVFFSVTLPMIYPAVIVGALFSFTISFDNITGTLFWKPAGFETLPTQVLAMLRQSLSPEINALGTIMVVVTIALPLLGIGLARRFDQTL